MSKPDWKEYERVVAEIKEFCIQNKVTIITAVQAGPMACGPIPFEDDRIFFIDYLSILE